MARGAHYYRSVHGSARLATAPLAASPSLARAEELAPGEMRRLPFEGELLGAARPRGRCAAIPFEAFDLAGERLEPEEQGAWFQLLRLSWGEGRNFCRVAKRDLLARLGTSERRLHRILDGLATKGFVKLLHRDNRGTLFRVYVPGDAAGAPEEPRARAVPLSPAPPCPAPIAAAPRATPLADARTRALAGALAEARGAEGDEDARRAAAAEIAELVAEGATPRQVEAAIRAVARRRATNGEPP